MSGYFADAGYWIALISPDDELHASAVEYEILIQSVHERVVTTQLVLNEVLNPRGGSTRQRRQDAVSLVNRILADPQITVIPQTPEQFATALAMLAYRVDREWSITDCASFLVMEEAGIWEALSGDHHFEQAGFAALLRQRFSL